MKICKLFSLIVLLSLSSCSTNTKNIEPSYKDLLALALSNKNFQRVSLLVPEVRMTENSSNIIQLFLHLHSENLLAIEREIEYLKQFSDSMSLTHQTLFNEMIVWLYLKQIYRHEISPPVRIIQREKLYLEPSHINFTQCSNTSVGCAIDTRKKANVFLSNDEIAQKLKKMALKDPCVNSSTRLQGEAVANRCLKKSKGLLKIELLPKPRFNSSQWLQIITTRE